MKPLKRNRLCPCACLRTGNFVLAVAHKIPQLHLGEERLWNVSDELLQTFTSVNDGHSQELNNLKLQDFYFIFISKTMQLKSLFLLCCFVCVVFSSRAQFEGMGSFSTDTLLIAQLKVKRVSSVTETLVQNGVTTIGQVYFDKEGRYVEMTYPYRVKLEYNRSGKVTKTTTYSAGDTGKVGYWFRNTYDDKDRHVKTEYGQYEGEKLTVSKKSESRIIKDKAGVLRMENLGYFNDKVVSSSVYLDSVSGIYRYVIVSDYEDQMAFYGMPGQGLTFRKKTLTRSYVIENCSYEDRIVYDGEGDGGHVMEFETTYQLRDTKGRMIEKGVLDVYEAYEKYLAAHPEPLNPMNPNVFPSGFVKLFLSGKVKGQRKASVTYTYNARGLLAGKKDYGSIYKYYYNEQDQLSQLTSEGYNSYTHQYWYNDKGLVIKMQTTPGKYDGTGQRTVPKESTYEYSYY